MLRRKLHSLEQMCKRRAGEKGAWLWRGDTAVTYSRGQSSLLDTVKWGGERCRNSTSLRANWGPRSFSIFQKTPCLSFPSLPTGRYPGRCLSRRPYGIHTLPTVQASQLLLGQLDSIFPKPRLHERQKQMQGYVHEVHHAAAGLQAEAIGPQVFV